jgi:hypothetical protein
MVDPMVDAKLHTCLITMAAPAKKAHTSNGEEPAITRFCDYLKINTMQPTPDYGLT